jgi:cell shape-determining protein MreC
MNSYQRLKTENLELKRRLAEMEQRELHLLKLKLEIDNFLNALERCKIILSWCDRQEKD